MKIDEMISVLQAAKEGKPIQFRYKGAKSWDTISQPAWEFGRCEYRAAPEPPREFWLTTNPSYSPIQHQPFPGAIHVREVLT